MMYNVNWTKLIRSCTEKGKLEIHEEGLTRGQKTVTKLKKEEGFAKPAHVVHVAADSLCFWL